MHKFATLLALAVTASLAAQSAVTITDANTTFTYSSYPTATNSTVGYCNFAAATADHAYQSWWYYALQGDANGSALNTAGGQMTASLAADNRSVLLDWPNVDARGFAAQLVNCVYSTGAASGVSAQALTITNNTASPLGLNLYFYTDLDVAGAAGDSASQHAGWPTGNHMVQDSAGVQCWVMADRFNSFDLTTFAVARGAIINGVGGAPYAPLNNGLPFGPGDYTGVYHWLVSIAPGQSVTQSALLAITQAPASQRIARASTHCVGKPGTHGVPVWALNRPFTGSATSLRIDNGFPGAAPILFLGVAPVAVPYPPFGTVCTFPIATLNMPAFNAARVSSLTIQLPNLASLSAAPLHWQALFLDMGAASFLAHTDGLAWSFGSFGN